MDVFARREGSSSAPAAAFARSLSLPRSPLPPPPVSPRSVCTPPISPATSPGSSSGTGSPTSTRKADALKAEMLGSPVLASPSIFSSFVGSSSSDLSGRVQLGRSRVADNYSMGKVLAQGDDYMVVEGLHLATHRSHALKLLSKQSPRFRRETQTGPGSV